MGNKPAYSPVFSESATEFLLQLPKSRQRNERDCALQLSKHPFVCSDYALIDEAGRAVEHLLIEEFVFAYWVDHSACEVRITDISDAN